MQPLLSPCSLVLMVGLTATGFITGCASSERNSGKEQDVSLAQLSEPARATVTQETAGGHVDKITKEVERGQTVYDVEATVGGKHMEYLIADADGKVLGTEVPIEFGDLPPAVRTAAEKYFGTSAGLRAMKGVEYGETQYEIEGHRNGRKTEVTFDSAGKSSK